LVVKVLERDWREESSACIADWAERRAVCCAVSEERAEVFWEISWTN